MVQERIRRRRLRRLLKIAIVSGVMLILSVLIYGFLYSGLFNVEKVEVSGAESVPKDKIIHVIEDSIKGRLYGILPKNHPVFINESFLIASIKGNFVNIADVYLRYNFGDNVLHISIRERKPIAYWCTSMPENKVCFLVDIHGVIYQEVLPDSEDIGLKILDKTQRALRPGIKVFGENEMMTILNLRERLKPEVAVSEFIIEPESMEANYARANTNEGWYILFDTNMDAEVYSQELKTLLANKIGSDQKRLEYIDLRIPGRAYYKLK